MNMNTRIVLDRISDHGCRFLLTLSLDDNVLLLLLGLQDTEARSLSLLLSDLLRLDGPVLVGLGGGTVVGLWFLLQRD